MKKFCLLLITLLFSLSGFSQTTFINEVNYLTPEPCLEIMTPEGTDLSSWEINFYDENGLVSASQTISDTVVSTTLGFDFIVVDVVLFFGTNSGMCLVDDAGNVVQFISLGNTIIAQDGPAAGMTSTNIGSQTIATKSLQLEGPGPEYGDFEWTDENLSSCGTLNPNQLVEDLANNTLPVELSYFKGKQQQEVIYLEWETLTEINNDFFLIERSVNGRDWQILEHLDGHLNTSISHQYDYTDKNPMTGVNYYRLSQVDVDGSMEIFDLVAVEYHSMSDILLFPNPASDFIDIKISNLDTYEDLEISVFNLFGENMNVDSLSPGVLDISKLKSGTYRLHLISGRNEYQLVFIKI